LNTGLSRRGAVVRHFTSNPGNEANYLSLPISFLFKYS
jgi:hypothetical protein